MCPSSLQKLRMGRKSQQHATGSQLHGAIAWLGMLVPFLHEIYDQIIIITQCSLHSDFFFTDGRAICIWKARVLLLASTSDSSFSEEQAVDSVAFLSRTWASLSQVTGGLGGLIIYRRLMAGFDNGWRRSEWLYSLVDGGRKVVAGHQTLHPLHSDSSTP